MNDVDGYLGFTFPAGSGMGVTDGNVAYQLNNPFGLVDRYSGAMALLQAAAAIREGLVETVIIAADADEAGEVAAQAAARRFIAEGRTAKIARPPQGMDFNDLLLKPENVIPFTGMMEAAHD